jgi:fatty-acyl-CoA synthase
MSATSLLVGDLFRRNAEVVPDAPAVSLGSEALSYAALNEAGNRVAAALRAEGIGRGDRVVMWADTALEVLPLFVALAKLGAVFAPVNAHYGAEEATPVLQLARPRLLVSDAARAEAGARVAAGCRIPHLSFRELAERAETRPGAEVGEPALRETDPHVLFFTSGSTGRPKGVVLSHRANWLRGFQGVFRDVPEISVCMFPLFHMAPFTLGLAAWQTRGELALVPVATADEILAAVERRRANRLYCIPAVWGRILAVDPARYDTSSLREVDTGTSATPIELVRALKERFPGTATRIYYGSTEVGSATTLPDADALRKPASVGPASPGVEVRLSEAGEVCVRSPFLFDGYFEDADATAAALQDGWFHTGDLGVCDDEGYISIVGRVKELIRTGGESVAPAEVEAALADHPAVADVAVVGLPDPEWGEVVCAVVRAATGAEPSLADLQKHCETKLAAFKKPRRLELTREIPRTAATGQVQRALIVQQIVSRPPRETR